MQRVQKKSRLPSMRCPLAIGSFTITTNTTTTTTTTNRDNEDNNDNTYAKSPEKLKEVMDSSPDTWAPPRSSFICPTKPLANAIEYWFTIWVTSSDSTPLLVPTVAPAAKLNVSVTMGTLAPVTLAAATPCRRPEVDRETVPEVAVTTAEV